MSHCDKHHGFESDGFYCVACQWAEITRLKAIVAKLPTDRNGEPFVDGDELWFVFAGEIVSAVIRNGRGYVGWSASFNPEASRRTLKAPATVHGVDGYSTKAAAEQARKEKTE